MSNTKSPKTIRELATVLEETLQLPDIVQRMMKSMNSILMVLSIILETGGKPGWHKEVNRHSKLLGETLNEKDEQTLQPLVNFVVSLPMASPKQNLLEPLFMRGGADPVPGFGPGLQAKLGLGALANKAKELKGKMTEAIDKAKEAAGAAGTKGAEGKEGEKGEEGAAGAAGVADAEKMDIDINIPYFQLVDAIKAMDAKSDTKAPIKRIQEAADPEKDPKPLVPLQGPLTGIIGPLAAKKVAETPVPVRLAVALGKTLLDILRLLSSMPGMDIPLLRQVFSVALASVEFYNGEWKQSLLSGAGIFSQSAMYMGFFSKLFLNIFSLISPNLQDDMIYGAYAVTKSIIVGALLYLFQIMATEPVRKEAMEFFKKLSCKNEAIDKILKDHGLQGQPANITPSMGDIQRVQSASQDWTLTCSTEFAKFIGDDPEKTPFTDNVILKLIFQMLNMPISMDEMETKCKNLQVYMNLNKYLSFKDLLVIEAGLTTAKLEELSPTTEEPAAEESATEEPAAAESTTEPSDENPTATATETETAPAAAASATATATPTTPAEPAATATGGFRRLRRALKPSSSPSRKKRKRSQPLSHSVHG